MEHLLTSEEQDGRFSDPAVKEMVKAGRAHFINMHRFDNKDVQHWMEKQVYLNMGTVLLGAGSLGIDAVPLEGIDMKLLDEELGFTVFNAALPKSRLPEQELFTTLL